MNSSIARFCAAILSRSPGGVIAWFLRIAVLALLAATVAMPGHAVAAVSNCSTSSAASLTMGNVTVQPNTPVGTLLGTPVSVSVQFNCSNIPSASNGGNNLFIQAGNLAPRDPMDTGANGIIFDTSIPGIGLKLTATEDQASASACLRCGPGSTAGFEMGAVPRSTGRLTQTFTAQFIKTGPVTAGVLQGVQLMQFWWYEYGYTPSSGPMSTALTLNGGATVGRVGCTVDTGSQNMTVAMPPVSTAALLPAAIGSVAGRTRFNINLTCESGTTASISFATTNAFNNSTGVIARTAATGNATNVGIQLLDATASAPVPFNTAKSMGATPDGPLSLPFHVQYYRTSTAAIAAGNVRGTLTFTMTYQ